GSAIMERSVMSRLLCFNLLISLTFAACGMMHGAYIGRPHVVQEKWESAKPAPTLSRAKSPMSST
ncbi:MAG: hypothetical protein WC690_09540, partial [bacterium]